MRKTSQVFETKLGNELAMTPTTTAATTTTNADNKFEKRILKNYISNKQTDTKEMKTGVKILPQHSK